MDLRSSPHDSTTQLVLQTIAAYERSATDCLARWSKRRHRQPPLLADWLAHLPVGARLLDLGCGGGQDAGELRKRGYRVVGLDRTRALLAAGRCRDPSLPLVLADLRQLPFQAMSFDGLWAAASLMHLPKPVARLVLTDLCRHVRPGGFLAATVTYGMKSGIVTDGWVPGRYFARWKKDELARAIRRAGWEILELRVVTNCERKGRWLNLLAQRLG
ncbi:MAG: class I SAM-dependent methyltransferase [Nitrospirota bacterium]|nr:class I SAM-dependent methyltransferase [Nitrospirota bacterium]MDP2382395.1 class I SAM-dependent methyltransferase [Nitrospirota bacterium]MDP3598729.1 class I SAM-dependent methyltransferase [Nitrospirota bacterium]